MINYTESLTHLMRDIVSRVSPLSFIQLERLLVFARFGRTGSDGALATCHCLCLPDAEPGYYYWRDSQTGELTRRSEWFVPRTPVVTHAGERLDYLISVVLPRFCNQSLARSRKAGLYRHREPWVGKLDTVVHELYHIDPLRSGIRQMASDNGRQAAHCHGPEFYTDVAALVNAYLETSPDPVTYEFLRYDFDGLVRRYGRITGTTFRNFPSYPQVYLDRLSTQPVGPETGVIVPLRPTSQPAAYTDADIVVREFLPTGTRRVLGRDRDAA
jgi:hypothetical protein